MRPTIIYAFRRYKIRSKPYLKKVCFFQVIRKEQRSPPLLLIVVHFMIDCYDLYHMTGDFLITRPKTAVN